VNGTLLIVVVVVVVSGGLMLLGVLLGLLAVATLLLARSKRTRVKKPARALPAPTIPPRIPPTQEARILPAIRPADFDTSEPADADHLPTMRMPKPGDLNLDDEGPPPAILFEEDTDPSNQAETDLFQRGRNPSPRPVMKVDAHEIFSAHGPAGESKPQRTPASPPTRRLARPPEEEVP
jgi:hypothetical protein